MMVFPKPSNSRFMNSEYFHHMRFGSIILFLILLVVPVAADLASTPWPKALHDYNNTAQSTHVASQTATLKWTYLTSGWIRSGTPVIGSDGTIYIGSEDNSFYAVNPDGSLKWKYTTEGVIPGSAAIGSDGTVYVGSADCKLYALNPDGTLKWSYTTGGTLYAPVSIGPEGTIYFGTSNTKMIYALNPDGTLKWSYTLGGNINKGCPAVSPDGTIYIGTTDKKLYALNPDGTLKWSYTTGGNIYTASAAIGSDGTLVFGSYDKKLYALNPDGTLKWSYTAGGTIYGSPVIDSDGTIYFGSYSDYKIYAVNSDGTLKWTYTTGNKIWGSPAIGADGTIYIGSTDSNVYALNPDGTLKWSYTTGGAIYGSSPAIGADGTLYIGSYDSKLYAFTGTLTATADQTRGGVSLPVQFTGTSYVTPSSWYWEFGDGSTSTEQNPAHTYMSAGFYTVNLTVTDTYGSHYVIQPDYIKVYSPPNAGFTSDVTSGKSPLSVTFTDQSTGVPTAWLWDFGDGTTSTEQNPTHTFSTTGTDTVTYTVNLTATNSAGSNTTSKTGYITLYSNPPTVSFKATPRIGTAAPLTVQFRDTSTLSPTVWLWDFGDGDSTNATRQNPVHTYATAGTYTVTLTATNAIGSSTASKPGFITFVTPGPFSNYNGINIYVANDEGAKFDINGTNLNYVPNTYYIGMTGGLNALSISDGAQDIVTNTRNQSGTFWLDFGGGQPTMHDGILMLAVNGTIPDDFSVRIRSSGDNWTMTGGPGTSNLPAPTEYNYIEGAVDETFTKADFLYGPQIWRPCSASNYPIYNGQDMSDTGNTFQIMFIDTRVGAYTDDIKIEYSFHNLTSFAAFNCYGWYIASNHGTGIIMTNAVDKSAYSVLGIPAAPVAGFTSSTTTADILSPVQFTDTSVNVPQSWLWEFGDGTTSIEQNPVHIYFSPGTYTVNLTVTNYKGTNKVTKTGYITKVISPPLLRISR